MPLEIINQLILLFVAGAAVGASILWGVQRFKLTQFKHLSKEMIRRAEQECEAMRHSGQLALKQSHLEQQRELEKQWQMERRKLLREEERIQQKEDKLENRMGLVEKKLSDIEKREAVLGAHKSQIDEEKLQIEGLHAQLLTKLEQISRLSAQEAKEHLLQQIHQEVHAEAANYVRKSLKEAQESSEREANRIIATAIGRLAVPCVSEATINTVTIPSDEMKGRIIGREGRNIRTLERATGITFVVDDTPGAIVLSGFDPVRMHIAKLALQELFKDGRIHPTRIEEAVEQAKLQSQKLILQYGEDAAFKAGAGDLHPELLMLLGRLKFRYSYGQNVLDHSLEVSYLMGMMAAEMGLDQRLAKRIGLLHDMGKAVSHEIEGTHAIIGHDLALKYGESPAVAVGIGCHHQEMDPTTIEATLCSSADAISASRHGARSEPIEAYIKRLQKLEEIACSFTGVEKAYAMQAGREVRVIVEPDALDDTSAFNLARDLTKRIENDVSYPGKIKVTVIREKRFVEYAV